MRFQDPSVLWLIALPLLLVALFTYRHLRRTGLLYMSDVATVIAAAGGRVSAKRLLVPDLLKTFAVAMLVVALARPQFGTTREETKQMGIDIFVALDCSGSMAAEDLKPTRLEAAKKVTEDFVKGAGSNRLGMILFAGKPMTLLPLSTDYGVLTDHIRRIRQNEIPFDGTNIGDALSMCAFHMAKETTKSKVVILATDGNHNTGYADPLAGAKVCKEKGIKVYTIGVGSEDGAPIPIMTPYGKQYQRGPNGQLQMEKLDTVTLKAIAKYTGGLFFRATDEKSLAEIFDRIGKMEKSEIRTSKSVTWSEQAPVFLLLGFGLLVAGTLLESGPLRRLE